MRAVVRDRLEYAAAQLMHENIALQHAQGRRAPPARAYTQVMDSGGREMMPKRMQIMST